MLFLNSSQNAVCKQNLCFKSSPQQKLAVVEKAASTVALRHSKRLGCVEELFQKELHGTNEFKKVVDDLANKIWKKRGGGIKSPTESQKNWNDAKQNVKRVFGLLIKSKKEPVYRFATKNHPAKIDQIRKDYPIPAGASKEALEKIEKTFTGPVQSTLGEIKDQALRLLGDKKIPPMAISINA